MKISVSSYSFQQYIRQGKITQYDTVEEAHKLGFEAIEFIDMKLGEKPGVTPALDEQKEYAYKIRKRADELGMYINAYTIGADLFKKDEEAEAEIERLKGQLEVAKILGVPLMRHDATWSLKPTGDGRSYKLQLPTIAANIRRVTEHAETLGIKTCSENHGRIFQDSYRMEELFCAVNHENYGLLVDMGNFVCVNEPSALAVSRLAPYAFHVHCKDFVLYHGDGAKPAPSWGNTRDGGFYKAMPVGMGVVPVKKCLRIMKQHNYDGYVSIEYEGAEDCLSGIAAGYENVKRYLQELEAEA